MTPEPGCPTTPDRWDTGPARISVVDADDGTVGGFGVEMPDLVGMTAEVATELAGRRGVERIAVLQLVDGSTDPLGSATGLP